MVLEFALPAVTIHKLPFALLPANCVLALPLDTCLCPNDGIMTLAVNEIIRNLFRVWQCDLYGG